MCILYNSSLLRRRREVDNIHIIKTRTCNSQSGGSNWVRIQDSGFLYFQHNTAQHNGYIKSTTQFNKGVRNKPIILAKMKVSKLTSTICLCYLTHYAAVLNWSSSIGYTHLIKCVTFTAEKKQPNRTIIKGTGVYHHKHSRLNKKRFIGDGI